jgi:hypothetical protein
MRSNNIIKYFLKYFFLLTILLKTYLLFSGEVDTLEQSLKLLKNVMKVDFEVKLIQPGEINIWKEKITKYTIPGHSILLKVEGTNLKFYGYFTPYTVKDERLLLLAQGQVWLSDAIQKSVRYLTCFKYIHLAVGEKAVFLPLGIIKSEDMGRVYNIEIEIQIYPYSPGEEESGN